MSKMAGNDDSLRNPFAYFDYDDGQMSSPDYIQHNLWWVDYCPFYVALPSV